MGSPAPAQLLDSGLCGLSLVAGYYRIAGDPAQLRHQLALTGRSAQAEDIVRGANILQAEVAHPSRGDRQASRRHSLSGDPESKGRRFRRPGRGFDEGDGEAGRSDRPDSARIVDGGHSGAVFRRTGADHAPIWRGGRRSHHLRVPLVLALDCALPARARPCAGRVAVCAIVRSGDADLFPARRRQGAGSQRRLDADRAGRSAW